MEFGKSYKKFDRRISPTGDWVQGREIIKRCTPLGSKCTPSRPIIKKFIGKNAKRLYGNHSPVTVEPVIVRKYRKALANRDFCK